MKSLILVIVTIIALQSITNASQIDSIDFNFEEINIVPISTNREIMLTYKDEIILLTPSLRISSDKGVNFKSFNYSEFDTALNRFIAKPVELSRLVGYTYDKDDGLYLLDFQVLSKLKRTYKYSILYLPPARDTVIIKNVFELNNMQNAQENEYIPKSFILYKDKILLHSLKRIWTFDTTNDKLSNFKFTDSLKSSYDKKEISNFGIFFVNYNQSEDKIDIFYYINDKWSYAYSLDWGDSYVEGVYDTKCDIGFIWNSMYQWNGKDSWYSSVAGKPFYRLDNHCPKSIIDLDINYMMPWSALGLPLHSNDRYLVFSFHRADKVPSRVYYSNQKGDRLYRLKSLPFQESIYDVPGYFPKVFSDGDILLSLLIRVDGIQSLKLVRGTPKYSSVFDNSQNINFIVSPNPAGDFITIQFQPTEGLETSKGSKVQIIDMFGIERMSESIHPMTSSHRMNVEMLPAGVYFIRIGNKLEKFVKM